MTDIEVLALAEHGRLFEFVNENYYFDKEINKWVMWQNEEKIILDKMPQLPSADEVNTKAKANQNHDVYNKFLCVETRAKYLGVYGKCEHCEDGCIYEEDKARIALQLWYLHPRQGTTSGIYIENINQEDVPNVIQYLKKAKERNNEKFSKI